MVQVIYDKLAVKKKKSGIPIFVFWDRKCLNFGQDWEKGFLNGLIKSQVIVLLISTKVWNNWLSISSFCNLCFFVQTDIGRNHQRSSNKTRQCFGWISCNSFCYPLFSLIFRIYECAIILNKTKGIPVVPVFLAEIDQTQPTLQFLPCRGTSMTFPNMIHKRKPSSQSIIEKLVYAYNNFIL